MKIAYFDCFSGISGDMILGALVDAGLDINILKEQLANLPIEGYEISAETVQRASITGTKVHVIISSQKEIIPEVCHSHHRNSHVKFSDIQTIIKGSNLHDHIKHESMRIFHRLAEAEAKVHKTSIEDVHFHEVGAIDSIVDIVGSVIAIHCLDIKKIYFSPIPTGYGYTQCEHGTFPVPTPATVELLKTHRIKSVHIEKELTTPTGASIVTVLGEGVHTIPDIRILQIGYGAGSWDNPSLPNLLRVFIGTPYSAEELDEMWIVETNIDNMSGELLGYAMEKLFVAGAVDVYFTPIQMKKGRPGTMISAIVAHSHLPSVESTMFNQTTTFGIRKYKVNRKVLTREIKELNTPLGKIKVKTGKLDGDIKSISPEYEDCKRIAEEKSIPLKQIYNLITEYLGIFKS